MTEGEIKQYAHEYAKKIIVFDSEFSSDKFRDIKQAFIEGADFMYYSNNEELKNQLTEKDKQIEELKDDNKACKFAMVMSEKAEKAKDKKIAELEAQIEELKKDNEACYKENEGIVKRFNKLSEKNKELEKEKVAREIIDRELLKKNDELEAQIEKMKCCSNCEHSEDDYKSPTVCDKCFEFVYWKLKE